MLIKGSLKRREIALVFALFLLCSLFFLTRPVNSQTTFPVVYIRSNGDLEPASVPIQRNGNAYVFTGDVVARGIKVQKEGVTIDGSGHSLMGPYNGTGSLWIIGEGPDQPLTNDTELWSIGIDMASNSITNLTIKNIDIKNFSIGMYLWTSGNIVTNNAVSECIVGILISADNNTITENYLANNKNGFFFGSNQPGNIPLNLMVFKNSFINNLSQLSGCACEDFNTTEPVHQWDNGKIGNYWSDYSGTDKDGDGVGDTPYVIDPLNLDRYPLVENSLLPPNAEAFNANSEIASALIVFSAIAVTLIALMVYRKKKLAKSI
jgi:hypothetical protein